CLDDPLTRPRRGASSVRLDPASRECIGPRVEIAICRICQPRLASLHSTAAYRQCLGMALLNSFDHSFSAPASVTPYTPRVDAGGPHRLIPHAVEANDLLMEPGVVLRDGNTVEGKTLRFSGQNGFEHLFVDARSYALTG